MTAIRIGLALTAVLLLAVIAACRGGDDHVQVTPTPTLTAAPHSPTATKGPTPTPTPMPTRSSSPTPTPGPTPTAGAGLPMPDPGEIHIVRSDGSGETGVFAAPRVWGTAWSPTKSELAVFEGGGPIGKLHVLGIDGHEIAAAEVDGTPSDLLGWSPDGRYVLFDWWDESGTSLSGFNVETGQTRVVAVIHQSDGVRPVGWLSDGEALAVRGAYPSGELIAFNLDNGSERTVTNLTVRGDWAGTPAISPNGKRLLVAVESDDVTCEGTKAYAVWIVTVADGSSARFTQPICGLGPLAWSADGQQIAYSAIDPSQDAERGIFVDDLASGDRRRLTDRLDRPETWLSNGQMIATRYICTGCDGPASTIAIDVGTGQVTDFGSGVDAMVAHSGDKVALASLGVSLVDVHGGGLATIAPAEDEWRQWQPRWSADDQFIAYARGHSQGNRTFEINADGSGFAQTSYATGDSTASPDGAHIATRTQQGPNVTLTLSNADGSDPVIVATNVWGSSWSPDGSRFTFSIAAVPAGTGAEALWLANGDGRGAKQVSGPALGSWRWSPDSQTLLFDDGGTLRAIDRDAGNPRVYSGIAPVGYEMAWSPDSRHVTVSSGFSLYILDVVTGQAALLSDFAASYEISYDWSADGGAVAIFAEGAVQVFSSDGTKRMTVDISRQNYVSQVAMSADGSQVAYMDYSDGHGQEVWVANVASGEHHMVINGDFGSMRVPAWSPDGTRIAIEMETDSGEGLYIVRADGSEKTQITRSSTICVVRWLGNERLEFTTFLGGM